MLLLSGPCMLFPFGEHKGHYVGAGRREGAYSKLQRGERLSNLDVHYLARGPTYVSPEEEKEASKFFALLGFLFFFLPGLGILVHLYATRDKTE